MTHDSTCDGRQRWPEVRGGGGCGWEAARRGRRGDGAALCLITVVTLHSFVLNFMAPYTPHMQRAHLINVKRHPRLSTSSGRGL